MEILNEPSGAQGPDRREVGALLEGHVESISMAHRLTVVALKTARLHVPGISREIGRPVRLHIPARDVMLATVQPQGLSALNILEGLISWISETTDGSVDGSSRPGVWNSAVAVGSPISSA